MIVLHPWEHMHPPVARALLEQWPETKLLRVGNDDYDTWDAIRDYWNQEDLVLVEQHKTVHDQVFPEFWTCPEPWCVFPHELNRPGRWARESIGCVRFSKFFQQRVTIRRLHASHGLHDHQVCDAWDNGICWQHIETEISTVGKANGFEVHNHWPGVEHWKVYHGDTECKRIAQLRREHG